MMKIARPFEIKVALIGNVSVGKTTVLNALFRATFGEVSMKRTTAGVNFFSVYSKTNEKNKEPAVAGTREGNVSPRNKTCSSKDSSGWSMVPDDPRSAESTLTEITKDNAELRLQSDDGDVSEKSFEIELDEELFKMRNDTKLIVVDIPGINEAGSSSKYRDYVSLKWDTFDCAVVVMDGRQGVNSEEAVHLLQFVETNLDKKKDIPVIILCNKVDDPEDLEQIELVAEARREVEAIFKVSDREAALEDLLHDNGRDGLFPVFIPLSAINGFIFRCGSSMDLDQFKKFDKVLIDKLGRERIGRTVWRKMSEEERVKRAYEEVIMDSDPYKAAISESNFDKFLLALSYAIEGDEVQRYLLEKQLKVAMDLVTTEDGIVTRIRSAYEKMQALSATHSRLQKSYFSDGALKSKFWTEFHARENEAFLAFKSSPCKVSSLALPIQVLIDYYHFSKECGWEEEIVKVVDTGKAMIRRQISEIMSEESKSDPKYSIVKDDKDIPLWLWEDLSPSDWENIFGSLLLLSSDKFFIETFGREKMMLDRVLAKLQRTCADAFVEPVMKCPRGLCGGFLDYNKRCIDCGAYAWLPKSSSCRNQSCPRANCKSILKDAGFHGNPDSYLSAAVGDLGVKDKHFHCSTCGLNYTDGPASKEEIAPICCPVCDKGLDFTRFCFTCEVYCCLPGTLQCKLCPHCNWGLTTEKKLTKKGKRKESVDYCMDYCKACKQRFREVKVQSLDVEYTAGGKFVPSDPGYYESVVRLSVPESPSDPYHFGHLTWKYCDIMRSMAE